MKYFKSLFILLPACDLENTIRSNIITIFFLWSILFYFHFPYGLKLQECKESRIISDIHRQPRLELEVWTIINTARQWFKN